jgi:uncharacterized protein (DUF169 family)
VLSLEQLLSLTSPPVAIAFVDAAPAGVAHVSVVEPASCGYWRRAAAGEVFYTTADDHKGCPIGAHTHNVPLSSAEEANLLGLVETMVGLQYLQMEEVPQIPRRKTSMRVAIYGPLNATAISPDVVLVRGNARQLMLLAEAAQAAGVAGAAPTMGRPTCAVIPQAINADKTAISFGCIGNRVYTAAADDEAYVAIPGAQLPAIEEKLTVIVHANNELEKFHRARAAAQTVERERR